MKLDRLLSILIMLLRRDRIKAQELANMFGVSVRTILRDVEAINLAGIPVVTYQGVNGGISLVEGYRLDRSVLTTEDMASIISSIKGVASSVPDGRHEVLVEKIKSTLTQPQLETLRYKTNQFVIDLSPWGENPLVKQKLATTNKSIENSHILEFCYSDTQGKKTQRRVEPYSLVLKAQKWYLYAWCLLRNDFRLFKLNRIKELTVTNDTFYPREFSPEPPPWASKWPSDDVMIELEIIFQKNFEAVVEDWFGDDFIVDQEGRMMVKVMIPENVGLYGFLLSFGNGLEVINPPHIRKALANIAKEIYNKYTD